MFVLEMEMKDKINVINAHPRLGESRTKVSALSFKEQGYDKLQDEPEEVYRELAELNKQYEAQFGFKFVIFVNGRKKIDIIPILKKRMHNSKAEEMTTAITDSASIARDRLKKLAQHSSL